MSKSQIVTGGIADDAVTANKTFGVARPNAKPLIINGNMAVAQRGTSFNPSSSSIYTVDRFKYETTSGATGDATITQEADAPASTNLRKSLKISPDATETLTGGQNIVFSTALEGQDVQVLGHGTSSPPKATLSFWVKSSKTGTYCVQVKEETITGESYLLFEYSISQANTWEQKILTWTGNSTHTLNDDNASGFRVVWHLACGSDDHASATTTWTDATPFKATSNQVNFFDSTSNNWYLTGVQLEVGEYTSATLPPFQHESYGENLIRCLRYFYCPNMNGESYTSIGQGGGYNSSRIDVPVFFPVPMRTAPSVSLSGGTAIRFEGNAEDITGSAISIGNVATTTGDVFNNSLSGVNQGYAYRLYLNDSGTTKMFFNSEL